MSVMDKEQIKALAKAHLEAEAGECRWCFAIDLQRVKAKEIARYDFPDATVFHYSCPRCGGEFSEYINGWGEDYMKERISRLYPELEGHISDDFFSEANHRVFLD